MINGPARVAKTEYRTYRVITDALPVYTLSRNEPNPRYGRKTFCLTLESGMRVRRALSRARTPATPDHPLSHVRRRST